LKMTSKVVHIYIYFRIEQVHRSLNRNLSVNILAIYHIREPSTSNLLQSNCSHAHIPMTHRWRGNDSSMIHRSKKQSGLFLMKTKTRPSS
jgi:hypothetical protein